MSSNGTTTPNSTSTTNSTASPSPSIVIFGSLNPSSAGGTVWVAVYILLIIWLLTLVAIPALSHLWKRKTSSASSDQSRRSASTSSNTAEQDQEAKQSETAAAATAVDSTGECRAITMFRRNTRDGFLMILGSTCKMLLIGIT